MLTVGGEAENGDQEKVDEKVDEIWGCGQEKRRERGEAREAWDPQSRKGPPSEGEESETSYRHWTFGSAEKRRQGSP
jgi:hypothetical protein